MPIKNLVKLSLILKFDAFQVFNTKLAEYIIFISINLY